VFEGGLEGMGEGIDLDKGCLTSKQFVSSSEFDHIEDSRRDAAM
jgi:hypothetical protein